MPRRVIAYIDGFNLYHGMMDAEFRKYLWLDIPSLVRGILLPDQELNETKYFTSRISWPQDSVRRQTLYIEALQTLKGLGIKEGRYVGEITPCRHCGSPFTKHSEKMTDVSIAISMIKDALDNRFDTAVLVTGDADQVPTIQFVLDRYAEKRVVLLFPPKRVSKELKRVAHVKLNVNEAMLRAAQLPRAVSKADGVILKRPIEWS